MKASRILSSVICGADTAAQTESSVNATMSRRGQYREHDVRVAEQTVPEPTRRHGMRRGASRALGRVMRTVGLGGVGRREEGSKAQAEAEARKSHASDDAADVPRGEYRSGQLGYLLQRGHDATVDAVGSHEVLQADGNARDTQLNGYELDPRNVSPLSMNPVDCSEIVPGSEPGSPRAAHVGRGVLPVAARDPEASRRASTPEVGGVSHAGAQGAGEHWEDRKAHLERIRDGFVARRVALDEQHNLRNPKSRGLLACMNCISGFGRSRRKRLSPLGGDVSGHVAENMPQALQRTVFGISRSAGGGRVPTEAARELNASSGASNVGSAVGQSAHEADLSDHGRTHQRTASSETREQDLRRSNDAESLTQRYEGLDPGSFPSSDGDSPRVLVELERAAGALVDAHAEILAQSDDTQREQSEEVFELLRASAGDSPHDAAPSPVEGEAEAVQFVRAALSQAGVQLGQIEQREREMRNTAVMDEAGRPSVNLQHSRGNLDYIAIDIPSDSDPYSGERFSMGPLSQAPLDVPTIRTGHIVIDIPHDDQETHGEARLATEHLPLAPLGGEVVRPDHVAIEIPDSPSSSDRSIGSLHMEGHRIWRGASVLSEHAGPSSRPRHAAIQIEVPVSLQAAPAPGATAPRDSVLVAASVGGLLRNLTDNQYTGRVAGLGASVANAILRDGSTVFVATALREVVGYLVQRSVSQAAVRAAGDPTSLREFAHQQSIVSAGILAGVAGLNLASLVYNAQRDVGTSRSVTSHAFNVAALGAAGALAYGTGTLGTVLPLLVKSVVYTALRDGINAFTRLSTNRPGRPPGASLSNMHANWAQMLVYSVNQFVTNTLQGTGQAFSGTSASGQARSLRGAMPHIAAFAGVNAAGEIADSVMYPILSTFFDHGGLHGIQALQDGISAVSNVRLSSRMNRPSVESAVEQLLGPFTSRTTVFTVLYAIAGALSQIHPSRALNENGVNRLTTAILSLLTGMLAVPFIGTLDTRLPTPPDDERFRQA